MLAPMCSTCGTEFPPGPAPDACPVCEDDRQYVNPAGQQWTSLQALTRSRRNAFKEEAFGLLGIGIEPHFAIGQRALLVTHPAGNILWDCIPMIDDATTRIVEALGGISAIVISHPHYYSAMIPWSEAFGGIPVWLHEADREWVMRPGEQVRFWSGDTMEIADGLTAIRTGGHFAGGTVLHWRDGAAGNGALLSGDILQVDLDRRYVSFMRSYPNYVPLSAAGVERIVDRIAPYPFDCIYGAFWGRVIETGARTTVEASARRYIEAVTGNGPADAEFKSS